MANEQVAVTDPGKPGNPIYKFLKENGLTDKDESSFTKEYSDSTKTKELYAFFKANSLTDKDESTFYDSYFKKKASEVSWATGFQNVGDPYSSSLKTPSASGSPVNTATKLKPYVPPVVNAGGTGMAPLPKLTIGNENKPAGFNAAFQSQIAKPVTDQERADVQHNAVESDRGEGVIGNAGNFLARTSVNLLKGTIDAISGGGSIARDLLFTKDAQNKMYLPDGSPNPEANDDLAEIIRGLDGFSRDSQEAIDHRQLSTGMVGQGLQTVSDITPDIVGSVLAPEVKIAKGAGIIGGYAIKALTNPFTRTLVARKALEGYRQANLKGEDVTDKVLASGEGAAEGLHEGTKMFLLGELGGAASNFTTKLVDGVALKPLASRATKAIVDQATQYAVWGTYSAGEALTKGEDIESALKEGNASGFVGLLLHNKGLLDKAGHTASENARFVQDFVDINDRIKTESFFRATPESIDEVMRMPGTAQDFHDKGMKYTEQAIKETDPEKRQELIQASSAFKKVADIKQSVEAVSTDKKSWEEMIEKSDLDPDIANAMKAKVDEVHKAYNPDEIQKSQLAEKITTNKKKVKAKKEAATEDPIQSAKDEVELESTHEEINKDTDELKAMIRNENSPISAILPGEKFKTLDGTEHVSSGRDVKNGIIMNSKGQSFPYDQVDLTKLKTPEKTTESSSISEQEAKPVSVIEEPVVTPEVIEPFKDYKAILDNPKSTPSQRKEAEAYMENPVKFVESRISQYDKQIETATDAEVKGTYERIKSKWEGDLKELKDQEAVKPKPIPKKREKAKKVVEEANPVETPAVEELKSPVATEDPLVVTEEALRELDYKTLSHRDIDKITRSGDAAEVDLSTKQSYQAVLKQEFSKLSKTTPETVQEAVRKFVGRVHEYRSKNRIKSEKFYKEKGAKEDFNGLNYWIDSAEALLGQKLGKSVSSSSQEVTRMRSDWAKSKMPEGFRSESDIAMEVKTPEVIEEVKPAEPEAPVKKERKPRAKKQSVMEKALDMEADTDLPVTKEKKEVIEPVVDNEESQVKPEAVEEVVEQEGLSQVGFDAKDKPVFVIKENVADYEKFTKAIEKKLERIANSDYAENSNESTERAVIDRLKGKLKDMEVKPVSFKSQKTVNATEASLLAKAETALNKLAESGRKDLKSGRKDFGAIMSPDVMIGSSKVIAAEIGKAAIKSVRGLERVVNKLISDGKLSAADVSSMSDIDKRNLLRLVQTEHARITSGKSAGELMEEGHERNAQAIKDLEQKENFFSKSTMDKLRSNMWDFNGNLIKSLNQDGTYKPVGSSSVTETTGQTAERLLKTMPAAYTKAEAKYSEAMNRVYGSGLFGEGKVSSLEKGHQKLLSDIVMYQRVIELDKMRLANGEKLMAHPGKMDMVQAEQRLAELKANDPSVVAKYGKYDFADLETRAKEYHQVLQDLIDYRFANGLISKGAYDALKDVKYYSPRVFLKHLVDSDGTYKSNSRVIEKTIKKIKGGDNGEVVTNLAKIMADSINVVYETAARNNSNKAIADVIENNKGQDWGITAHYSSKFIKRLKENQLSNSPQMSSPALSGASAVGVLQGASRYKYIEPEFAPGPKGFTLKTYRDGGIKRGFYIKDQYAKELDGLKTDANKWIRHLSGASTTTMLATGTNWYFAATNPIRDAGFAMFTTDHYSNIFPVALGQYTKDFVSSIKDSITKSGDYKKYIEQGGGNDYIFSGSELGSGHEGTFRRDMKAVIEMIAHRIPSTFESAGRLAVRKRAIINLEAKAKAEGVVITPEIRQNIEEQATYSALKVLNFAEGGRVTKAINQAVPFSNVGVIASRNLVRYVRSNPKEFTAKVAQLSAFVIGLSAWNNGVMNDDKEMAKYYTHNISESDKSTNFIVMTPIRYKNSDGNLQYMHLRIPKSQDQMIFAGAAEYGSMMAMGVESYTPEKWLKHRAFKDSRGIISYLPESGNLLPPVIKGVLSYKTDYDWFRGEHYTKSSEMASRKPEDQYDPLQTPERWKTIGKATGLSPIKLQGAFKSSVPTSNQWFDGADALYTAAFGEDTKAIALRNKKEGSFLDKLEKQMDSSGLKEADKQDFYEFLVKDMITKTPGIQRLVKMTSATVIDEDRNDKVAEAASDTFHDTEAMKISAYEYRKGNISRDQLIESAKNISKDPLIIKKAIGQAKAAIKLKRGTPEAFDVVFSGIASPEGQANLLFEKVQALGKDDGLKLISEIRNTGLFKGSFWVQYKRLESEKNNNK